VQAWESPWVREVWCAQQNKALHVTLPAGAALVPRAAHAGAAMVNGQRVTVLLVCDLGTAPVVSYREMLRRLLVLREGQLEDGKADPVPELFHRHSGPPPQRHTEYRMGGAPGQGCAEAGTTSVSRAGSGLGPGG
jgi:hypothetical protein